MNSSRILQNLSAVVFCLFVSLHGFAAADFENCRNALIALTSEDVRTKFAASQLDEIRDAIGQLDSHVEAVQAEGRFLGKKALLSAADTTRQQLSDFLEERKRAAGRGGFILGEGRLDVDRLGSDSPLAAEAPAKTAKVDKQAPGATKVPAPQPKTGLERFTDLDSARVIQPEYFDPKLSESGTSVDNYLRLSLGDSILGPRLQAELRAIGADPQNPSPKQLLVASMKNPDLRRSVAAIARETLTRKEAEEAARVAQGNRAVDVLFIGAGLHEATDQNYLRQLAPEIDTVTIEGTNEVGSTFAQGAKAVSLNSSSKKPDRENYRQRLGEGDLNYLPGGLVQVHQFDNSANPDQLSIAQALVVNRSFGKPILFNRRVVDVSDNPNRARDGYEHVVTLSDGSKIKARYVLNFGLGKERIPDLPGLRDAYGRANEAAKQNPNQPPGIQTYGEFFRFVRGSQSPYSPFSGKRIAVIGPGDSGKAVVRWLLRTNVVNPESYGRDSSEVAAPKSIPWHGQECQSCEVFFGSNRSFYSDITKGYRNKTLVALDKLVSVVERDGKYLLRDALGNEGEVDHIVLTTGFESQIPDLFPSLLASRKNETILPYQENPKIFSNINGFEPSLGEPGSPAPVILARRLTREDGTPTNVILSGPSAGRIVSPEELKEIEENFVANANHNWRVWRTMDAIAKDIKSQKIGESTTINSPSPERPRLKAARNGDAEMIYALTTKNSSEKNAGEVGDGVNLAARIYQKLTSFNLQDKNKFDVIISNTGSEFQVRFQPPIAKDQAEGLIRSFEADKELLGLIESAIGARKSAKTVRLEFALDGGRLAPSGTLIDLERVVDGDIAKAIAAEAAAGKTRLKTITASEGENLRAIFEKDRKSSSDGYYKPGSSERPYSGRDGYARTARELFDGDMVKAHDAAAQMNMIESMGWPGRFSGSIDEYEGLVKIYREDKRNSSDGYYKPGSAERPNSGFDGYAAVARKLFGGDMVKAHNAAEQLNLIKDMGWPTRFDGSIDEYEGLLKTYREDKRKSSGGYYKPGTSERPDSGFSGYAAVAKKLFGGDMVKTHDAAEQLNMIADMGWPNKFYGSVGEFEGLLKIYGEDQRNSSGGYYKPGSSERPNSGFDGYAAVAKKLFGGNMVKAHDAAEQMGLLNGMGWPRRFDGSVDEYEGLLKIYREDLRRSSGGYYKPGSSERPDSGFNGYAAVARKLFGGDMVKAHDAAEQLNMIRDMGWPNRFEGSVGEYEGLLKIYREDNKSSQNGYYKPGSSQRPYSGSGGYLRIAKEVFNGDLALAYDRMEEIVGEDGIQQLGWTRIPQRVGPKPDPVDIAAKKEAERRQQEALELKKYRDKLFSGDNPRKDYIGIEGQLKWAGSQFKGNNEQAYQDAVARLPSADLAALKWTADLKISVDTSRNILSELPGSGFFSKNGFKSKYRGGTGLKLVAKEYFDGDSVLAITTVKALLGEKFSGLDW